MKSLLISCTLALAPLAAFAQVHSLSCIETKGGQTVAQFDADSETLSVVNLRGGSAEFKLLHAQPTVLGGVLLISKSQEAGYATLNVDENGTSTLQALGTSAYMTCR